MNNINSSGSVNVVGQSIDLISKARRFLPSPAGAGLGKVFQSTLQNVAGIGGGLIGGVNGDVFGELKELLQLQVETQAKMQSISMLSNVERSRHESRMAAIRNVRTG